MLYVKSYVPALTPKGNPVNDGVMVATPAFMTPGSVPGSAVQQWMCEADVLPSSPLNDASTRIVSKSMSNVARPQPVPGDELVGNSAGPLNVVK